MMNPHAQAFVPLGPDAQPSQSSGMGSVLTMAGEPGSEGPSGSPARPQGPPQYVQGVAPMAYMPSGFPQAAYLNLHQGSYARPVTYAVSPQAGGVGMQAMAMPMMEPTHQQMYGYCVVPAGGAMPAHMMGRQAFAHHGIGFGQPGMMPQMQQVMVVAGGAGVAPAVQPPLGEKPAPPSPEHTPESPQQLSRPMGPDLPDAAPVEYGPQMCPDELKPSQEPPATVGPVLAAVTTPEEKPAEPEARPTQDSAGAGAAQGRTAPSPEREAPPPPTPVPAPKAAYDSVWDRIERGPAADLAREVATTKRQPKSSPSGSPKSASSEIPAEGGRTRTRPARGGKDAAAPTTPGAEERRNGEATGKGARKGKGKGEGRKGKGKGDGEKPTRGRNEKPKAAAQATAPVQPTTEAAPASPEVGQDATAAAPEQPLEVKCVLTGVPVTELPCAPFVVMGDGGCVVDPKIFALTMLAQSSFAHPFTRKALRKSDLLALQHHLVVQGQAEREEDYPLVAAAEILRIHPAQRTSAQSVRLQAIVSSAQAALDVLQGKAPVENPVTPPFVTELQEPCNGQAADESPQSLARSISPSYLISPLVMSRSLPAGIGDWQQFSRVGGVTRATREQEQMLLRGGICPYSRAFVLSLVEDKSLKEWISKLERKLVAWVDALQSGRVPNGASFALDALPPKRRAMVHELCWHLGLETTVLGLSGSADRRSQRSVEVSMRPWAAVPAWLPCKALEVYSALFQRFGLMEEEFPSAESCRRLDANAGSLHLWDIHRLDDSLPRQSDVFAALSELQQVEAVGQCTWLDQHSVIVTFSNKNTAHRVLAGARARTSGNAVGSGPGVATSGLRFLVQWYSGDVDWAVWQMQRRKDIAEELMRRAESSAPANEPAQSPQDQKPVIVTRDVKPRVFANKSKFAALLDESEPETDSDQE